MNYNKSKSFILLKEYVLMVVGCFITAFASNCVLKPNGLSTSGITGLSIVLESIIHINYTYIYYVLTGVVLLFTLILIGKKEVMKIIALSILFPTMLVGLQALKIEIILDDLILAILLFGFLYGLGVGIVLKINYSFGGTDTIAKIVHKRVLPFVNISLIMLFIDGMVLLFTAFTMGLKIALYGVVGQVVLTKVIDYVMFGFGTKLYKHNIISEKYNEISQFIMHNLKRGVTMTKVVGAYTNADKTQITCVCSPKESVAIREFIAKTDVKAYDEVIPIVSVWGVGNRFKHIDLE